MGGVLGDGREQQGLLRRGGALGEMVQRNPTGPNPGRVSSFPTHADRRGTTGRSRTACAPQREQHRKEGRESLQRDFRAVRRTSRSASHRRRSTTAPTPPRPRHAAAGVLDPAGATSGPHWREPRPRRWGRLGGVILMWVVASLVDPLVRVGAKPVCGRFLIRDRRAARSDSRTRGPGVTRGAERDPPACLRTVAPRWRSGRRPGEGVMGLTAFGLPHRCVEKEPFPSRRPVRKVTGERAHEASPAEPTFLR